MAKKKNTLRQFLATYTEEQIEWLLEWPMIFLTLLLIPIMALPAMYNLSPTQKNIIYVADVAIWGAFYFEMFVKLLVSRDRIRTLKRNWFLALILFIPSLRLFKLARLALILRTLRLLRLQSRIRSMSEPPRKLFYNIEYGIITILVVVFVSGFFLWQVEKRAGGAIQTFGDALWWSVITVTTVGYGDAVPTSDAGRILGGIMAIVGVLVFMIITAKIASYFVHYKVQEEHTKSTEALLRRLEAIETGREKPRGRSKKRKIS